MTSHERWNALLDIIARDGRLEVESAATELAVSAATIRRDLDHLAQQQMITRTRGGAVAHNVSYDLPLRYKTARHATEKELIAKAAAALVAPGAVVGLNGGTTTTEVARALATRTDLTGVGVEPALTVVTNAVNIANELVVRQHIKLVVTGGVARPQSYELTGPLATLVLPQLTLDHLAQQQMITRTRGGAVAHNVSYDLPLRYKTARHATEKELIAKAAAALVAPGAVVGLNGGTTTTEVARALATRTDLTGVGAEPALTVVTNAVNIANELVVRQHIKLVVTGGVARPQSYELTGPLATLVLPQLTLDHLFLGVDAISADAGATAYNEGEASINRLMVSRARRTIVVADSSKLGKSAFTLICRLDEVDALVTDTAADPDLVAAFGGAGVQVIQA